MSPDQRHCNLIPGIYENEILKGELNLQTKLNLAKSGLIIGNIIDLIIGNIIGLITGKQSCIIWVGPM